MQIHVRNPDGSVSNHEEEAAENGTLVSDFQGHPYHTLDQYSTTDVESDFPYSRQVRTLRHHVVPLGIDLQRDDRRVVPYNATYSAATQCNTSFESIMNSDGTTEYLANYMSKDAHAIAVSATSF